MLVLNGSLVHMHYHQSPHVLAWFLDHRISGFVDTICRWHARLTITLAYLIDSRYELDLLVYIMYIFNV